MAHHAYLVTGDIDAGIAAARAFGERELGLSGTNNPDIVILRYGHFPVEEARRVVELASQSALKDSRLIVIAAERLFHEAQNALLKIFEEPPQGTTLVLVVPAEGQVLQTMRSRLLPLPIAGREARALHPFVVATEAERKKIVEKLLNRSKADRDEEKQAARAETIRIVEDLTRAAHEMYLKKGSPEQAVLLAELARFTPILHERSAPLKLIFEHLLLVLPRLR
ncbi:MAG TPA: hypothetical protein VEA36_02965 [Candidatus Paceibacterota bacterium]|nr:hypothetical protein [Candidatus Paceibacterota bacterium]